MIEKGKNRIRGQTAASTHKKKYFPFPQETTALAAALRLADLFNTSNDRISKYKN